jgi:hypothetical protein
MAGPGAAFVFVNPSTPIAWTSKTEGATLTEKNGKNQDRFGYTTTISENGATIVAGEPGLLFPQPQGAAFVFQVPADGWSGSLNETQALTASSGTAIGGQPVTPASSFGQGLSISGDASTIGIGGNATVGGTSMIGVVYLF